jgi:integrase
LTPGAGSAPGRSPRWRRIIRLDLLPAWDLRPAAEIRSRDVAAVLDRILARGAPVQANRTRAWAHRIFAFALEREIVEFNPVAGPRRPTQEHSRQCVLNEEEIRALWTVWEAERSVTSALFRMILVTAQRRQEIAAMR